MGKNKLKKFREMEDIPFVLQYPWAVVQSEGFPHRGRWDAFFGNSNPVTLELGCGKGEYTVEMARRYPERNFVGVDIKGARMWTGAKAALAEGLKNVAFLRTDIEMLPAFFSPGEVDEIWITFPDPQMQKPRKRLTGSRMLALYRQFTTAGARVNLKTDSPFLYTYTRMLCGANGLKSLVDVDDVYSTENEGKTPAEVLEIRTHYENQWLGRGLTIKFLSFGLQGSEELQEPEGAEDIEKDTYRSYSRGHIQMPQNYNNE